MKHTRTETKITKFYLIQNLLAKRKIKKNNHTIEVSTFFACNSSLASHRTALLDNSFGQLSLPQRLRSWIPHLLQVIFIHLLVNKHVGTALREKAKKKRSHFQQVPMLLSFLNFSPLNKSKKVERERERESSNPGLPYRYTSKCQG